MHVSLTDHLYRAVSPTYAIECTASNANALSLQDSWKVKQFPSQSVSVATIGPRNTLKAFLFKLFATWSSWIYLVYGVLLQQLHLNKTRLVVTRMMMSCYWNYGCFGLMIDILVSWITMKCLSNLKVCTSIICVCVDRIIIQGNIEIKMGSFTWENTIAKNISPTASPITGNTSSSASVATVINRVSTECILFVKAVKRLIRW